MLSSLPCVVVHIHVCSAATILVQGYLREPRCPGVSHPNIERPMLNMISFPSQNPDAQIRTQFARLWTTKTRQRLACYAHEQILCDRLNWYETFIEFWESKREKESNIKRGRETVLVRGIQYDGGAFMNAQIQLTMISIKPSQYLRVGCAASAVMSDATALRPSLARPS